ncbi:MAG: class I SAM-dependent methyltransferase [Pontimonas sp.]
MTVTQGYEREYDAKHLAANPHCYPVEFVVRTYLGRYDHLRMDKGAYRGATVLDLGFGDGRNLPLLANLGMDVHGVEVTEEIVRTVSDRIRSLGVACSLKVGSNVSLPYPAGYFDHVLACHSLYYVADGTRFADNIREIGRVMKPGGRLVFSAPMSTNYYIKDADTEDQLHYVIRNDPLGIREGTTVAAFADPPALQRALSDSFQDLVIGSCRDDYYGLEQNMWIGVATRR